MKKIIGMPEPSAYLDEVLRSMELTADPPDQHLIVHGEAIQVWNGGRVCHLTWTGSAWKGSCRYGAANDPIAYPCRHVLALERWRREGLIPDPRFMILDPTLITRAPRPWLSGATQRDAYRPFAELWRTIAQDYAARNAHWDVDDLAGWYHMCTARWACGGHRYLDDTALVDLWFAELAWDDDLPPWFDTLCQISDALIDLLQQPGWAINWACRDAFCDWVCDLSIDDDRVRDEVHSAVEQFVSWHAVHVCRLAHGPVSGLHMPMERERMYA